MRIKRNIYQVYIGNSKELNEVFTTLDKEYAFEIFQELIKGEINNYIQITENIIFKGIDVSIAEAEIEEKYIMNQISDYGFTREELVSDFEEDLTTQDFDLNNLIYQNLRYIIF